ncbi:MAG: hypothetical protein L7U57_04435 [Glaciecola sp.]|nr:hypothetical protein [Glaciecola sp.]
MKPYLDTADLIKNLESEIDAINKTIAILKRKPKSFNEEVIHKYIDTQSTGKTKDFVRAQGVTSERGSLFSSSDVSRLIKDGAKDISPDLLAIARRVVGVKKKHGK